MTKFVFGVLGDFDQSVCFRLVAGKVFCLSGGLLELGTCRSVVDVETSWVRRALISSSRSSFLTPNSSSALAARSNIIQDTRTSTGLLSSRSFDLIASSLLFLLLAQTR